MPLNLVLAASMLAVQLALMLLVPTVLLPRSAAWGWLLLPGGLLSLTQWALIHECIHGTLSGQPARDDVWGRMLSWTFGAPYRALRVGHLFHHRYNRQDRDATEVYAEDRQGWGQAAWGYYGHLMGGLYLGELLVCFVVWLPRRLIVSLSRRLASNTNLVEPTVKLLSTPHALRELRLDALIIVLLWSLSAWCYGASAWMLALFAALRGLLISMHDNVYHYGTPLNDPGARTLRLPGWASTLLLHFNYHDTHHRYPRLGWRRLPQQFAADGGSYAESWVKAWGRQLYGPLARPTLPTKTLSGAGEP